MDKVGIGVIGLGFGRTVQIPGFQSLNNVELAGVWGPRPAITEATAKEFSVARRFDSWEDLIRCPEVSAVSVATPSETHRAIVEAVVAAGKSVLCEKPLGKDAQDAASMLARVEKSGCTHMVDFELREIPAFLRAKEVIQSGELGAIDHVDVRWFVSSWADASRPWSWRSERLGAGVLGALGVHVFDYVEWMFSPIVSVTANLQTCVKSRPDAQNRMRDVQSEDSAQVLLKLASGTSVTLQLSNVAVVNRGHWIEAFGNKKHLRFGSANSTDYGKDFSVWETATDSAGPRELDVPPLQSTHRDGRIALFTRLATRFVDCVRSQRSDGSPSFREGWRAQVILDAVLKSARQHEWVQV